MSEIQTEYSRLLMKRTSFAGIVPTINRGATLSDSWGSTDIMEGEFFFNSNDVRLWIRAENSIHEISLSGSSVPYTKECLLYDTISTVTTGPSKSVYISERDFDVNEIYATCDLAFLSGNTLSFEVFINDNPMLTGNTLTIPGDELSSFYNDDQPTLLFNKINKGDKISFNILEVKESKRVGVKIQFVGTTSLPVTNL